jgi:NAD(P)-dependent dehydrogenase (short-subunit alcohol dehydrogenase family)
MSKPVLRGKVAIVTGGSRGIGLAIAQALVAEGVQVAIIGRSESHLSAARPLIEAAGPGAVETLRADVRAYAEVERAITATVARFGGLDILVNNAGVGVFADVAEMTPGQWGEVIDTNLTGVFNACHAALPHLGRRNGGFIVNISSLAGKNPFAGAAAYCASKSGLIAFSEALIRRSVDHIRVSCVMPGSVATEFAGNDEPRGRLENRAGRRRSGSDPAQATRVCRARRVAAIEAAEVMGSLSAVGSQQASR